MAGTSPNKNNEGEPLFNNHEEGLTWKVFRFEQTCMYEILVRGPLCTSEYTGECRLSANLCKRALDVTAGAIVEATRNADILIKNANAI